MASPSLEILSQTQTGIFPISGFLVNCQKIAKTPEPAIVLIKNLDQQVNLIRETSEKFDNNIMLANCDVIVIFLIYGQFGAIPKLDSGRIVSKTYIFINSNLLSYKN